MSRSKDGRQFCKVSLDYLQNPKISKLYRDARKQYGLDGQQLADQAVIAYLGSLIYSRSSLTDGALFPEDAFSIARTRDREAVDELLVAVDLWETDGDERHIHDYDLHQEMKADVERRSAASAKANRARWSGSDSGSDTKSQSGSDSRGEERRGEEIDAHHADADAPVDVPADKPPLAAAPRATSYPEQFEQFWKVYPAKKGKRKALVAWRAAVKRASNDEIIAGAKRYAADPRRDPEHTKYAEGWLSGDRWLDEPETKTSTTANWWEE